MAGKGSKVVENQCHLTMQCSVERLTAVQTRHFPKHLPEKSLSNCRAKVSFSDLCMHLSHVVFGPQEAFPSSVRYGSESGIFALRLPDSMQTHKKNYNLVQISGKNSGVFVLGSTDQPLSTSVKVLTSLHAAPGNILSYSNFVPQYGN